MLLLIFHSFLVACLMVNGMDIHDLTMKGRELNEKEVVALESNLKDSPNDVDSRTMILGYYFGAQFRNRELAKTHQQHVLWLVENAPEAEVLSHPEGSIDHIMAPKAFAKAKKLLLKHLEDDSDNLVIIKNASAFFAMSDPDKTEELLNRAAELAPKDAEWPLALGHLHSRKMIWKTGKQVVELAASALKHFERAYELSDEMGRDAILTSLGKVAFAAGEMEKAKTYATKMLEPSDDGKRDWNYGNKIYDGNQLLGRIALKIGNLDEAKKRLLESAKTPGSPQLGSFGPNMLLAKEMIEAGEKEVVAEYFDLCGEFWEMGADKLEDWKKIVEAGQQPNFGANLNY